MKIAQHLFADSGHANTTSAPTVIPIDRHYEFHYMNILFFSDEAMEDKHHIHTKDMAGTIHVECTDNRLEWVSVANGDIVLGQFDGYARPNIQGNYLAVRVDLSDVTDFNGATHFKFSVNSNERV